MAVPNDPMEKSGTLPRSASARSVQVCLVVDDEAVSARLVQALEARNRYRTSVFRDAGALQNAAAAPDAILISLAQFAQLRESAPMAFLRLSRRSRIIVVLESRELLDAAPMLAFADAWLFSDLNASLAPELIDLGLEGHCLVPSQFLSRLGIDEIRLALIADLGSNEFETLRYLGQGLNNRTIGERLHLSEAVVKSIVRSVLSKLHFRNRTEAGVFAARQESALAAERDRRSGEDDGMPAARAAG
jgi:two-component system nitrate/nitrite response regulator NarL